MMKLIALVLCSVGVAGVALAAADTPSTHAERAAAACLLAHGRWPAGDESAAESGGTAGSVAELVARQRGRIAGDAALQRAVVDAAVRDAFGRAPNAEELSEIAPGGLTYAVLVQRHVARLATHPDEYAVVVDRAYRRTLDRAADPVEFDYWKQRPAVTFALLVGCLENWARRNSPGLTVTSGTPSISANGTCLATLRLSPGVAAEACAAIGLPALADRPLAAARGCHVVAPGAAEIASVGGVHFLAVGGESLRAD